MAGSALTEVDRESLNMTSSSRNVRPTTGGVRLLQTYCATGRYPGIIMLAERHAYIIVEGDGSPNVHKSPKISPCYGNPSRSSNDCENC